ncbi:MAG: hypothetical protein LQ339_004754 [Xanthoria mediterranea]|nr:MAG: hypothetical protein LQ339_004754 [Xanthoria mediterranea]
MLSWNSAGVIFFGIVTTVYSSPTDLQPTYHPAIPFQESAPSSINRRQNGLDLWLSETPLEVVILTAFALYAYLLMVDKLLKWSRRRIAENLELESSSSYRIGGFTYRWACDFHPIPRDLLVEYLKNKKTAAERWFIPVTQTEWWARGDGKVCWIRQNLDPMPNSGNRKVVPGGR